MAENSSTDVKRYPYASERRYVLQTTWGCYTDSGWCFAAGFADLEEAKKACDHWNTKGGMHRIVEDGRVIYESEK